MTLWFDVTDLSVWDSHQLTGIQRTAVNVLAELLTLRDDVRLFRYDCRSSELLEVNCSSLPVSIRQRLYSAGPEETCLASANAHCGARPFHKTLTRLVRRFGNDEILYIMRECRRDALRLAHAVHQKVRGPSINEHPLPPPLQGISIDTPIRPLFKDNDICLSLSATWGFAGYGEVIARHKSAARFTCINLIYDLIPTLFPHWVSPGWSRAITLWVRQQIANADLILTISHFQKKEIETFIKASRLPAPEVRTVRLGDDAKFDGSPPLPRKVLEGPFVLCVSTVDVRKNQLCLYHVWRRLAQTLGSRCPQLVLVGIPHELISNLLYQIRHDPAVNGLISHLSDVNDAELAWYYKHSLFTVYPSMYEGWGLPVGESLAHGKYCIISNAASLPEAGGNFADYFDPLDFMECYRKVRRAIDEPAYVQQREQLIRDTYECVTWRTTAAQISSHADSARRIAQVHCFTPSQREVAA